MSAKNLLRKHELVQSEITAHEPQINNVLSQAEKIVEEGMHHRGFCFDWLKRGTS